MFQLASKARPYFGAVVISTALLVAGGIYSATRMPSSVYPEVTFPRIVVVAKVPGRSVPEMEVGVTRPLEDAIREVIGVSLVRSKTIRGGSEISIDFNPGTDMRWAKGDTWNRINAIRSQLPPEVDLTVEQMSPSVFPVISVVLTGSDNPSRLREYAYYELAPRIKNLHDVLFANVAGGDIREIQVLPRLDRLLAAGLSASDLADQIGKIYRLQPIGRVERPPFGWQFIINTQYKKAQELRTLRIPLKNNQEVPLDALADIRVGHQDRTQSIGFENKDSVVVTIFRRLGGDTVTVSRALRALLKQLAQKPAAGRKAEVIRQQGEGTYQLPGNVQATVVYDQAGFVRTSVLNVRDAILVGGLFSILILLVFLRSWRATLISTLAIPITLAITLLFLNWTGETLNLMSLGGLAVAIGLIIDDTVVVIENIARHLQSRIADRGLRIEENPQSAIRNPQSADPVDAASREITGAVIGSTLTTVLVLVPLAFIAGVYGQFFASLSVALSIAVLVSMVISLTLVPVFAGKFLAGRPMPGPGPIYRFVEHVYERVLKAALHFPTVPLVLSVLAVVGIVGLYTGMPGVFPALETGLMPNMDEGAFILDYFAPSGTPLEITEKMAQKLEGFLSENPDVQSYLRRTGSENGLFVTQTFRGDITVVLRPAEDDPLSLLVRPVRPKFSDIEDEMKQEGATRAREKYGPGFTEDQMWGEAKAYVQKKYRRRSAADVMSEIEDEIKEHFGEHQLRFETIPIMQDELDDMSGASRPIEVKLFGPDYSRLRELARKVGDALEKKGNQGLHEIENNVRDGNPDLEIRIKQGPAARWNITTDLIVNQLRTIYVGQVAGTMRESAIRITDIRVRSPNLDRFGRGRFDPDLLRQQWVLLPDTKLPLPAAARLMQVRDLATVTPTRTPDEQWRENQQPAIFVTARIKEKETGLGSAVEVVRGVMQDLEKQGEVPTGYRWELGGHYVRQQQAFVSLGMVLVVAVLLVYIMLAFQFRSVVLPWLIFWTQPLSLFFGFLALYITNTPLNVSSAMGIILLVGLDMKNGILLVEYIQQLRREGMALEEALIVAGRTRFRPILMTSLAAILGLFPLALGIGPGAQMQQPLAIMVIGGLTANMLFTRMIIPVGYLVLERLRPVAS